MPRGRGKVGTHSWRHQAAAYGELNRPTRSAALHHFGAPRRSVSFSCRSLKLFPKPQFQSCMGSGSLRRDRRRQSRRRPQESRPRPGRHRFGSPLPGARLRRQWPEVCVTHFATKSAASGHCLKAPAEEREANSNRNAARRPPHGVFRVEVVTVETGNRRQGFPRPCLRAGGLEVRCAPADWPARASDLEQRSLFPYRSRGPTVCARPARRASAAARRVCACGMAAPAFSRRGTC